MARSKALLLACCVCAVAGDDIERLVADAQKQPQSAVLCERVGVAYVQREDLPHAREWFEKALAIDPARVSARKNLATVLWFQGERGRAERLFAELARRVPTDPVPHLYLGLASYGRGQFAEAAGQFDEAGALASSNPEVTPLVAETYLQVHRYAEAVPLLEALPRAAPVYIMLGEAYDGMNRPAQAYDAFRNAVAADTTEESAVALAQFSIRHGNIAYAREVLGRAITAHAGSAKLLFEDGVAAALGGNFDDALKRFAEAERISPDWAAPVLAEGVALLQQGKPDEAVGSFRRAARIAPEDSRAHLLLAMALLRSGAKTDAARRTEATGAARQAIQLDPKSGRAHAVLGELEQAANRPETALRELEAANRLDPGNATTLYQLGQAYRRQGREAEARTTLAAFEQAKAKSKAGENELVEILVKAQ